jgi:hypothetical protein
MPAELLKIGLIGAGRIGRLHAEHFITRIPSAELLMVADVFEENAKQCAKRYAIPLATQDYHAILARPDIEAVMICSSTDTHARIIEEAAQAGKHIFCEKPIALDLSTIDRALDAVKHAGVKLQLGFNRRFDASYRRVRQAVEQGEMGRLQQIHRKTGAETPVLQAGEEAPLDGMGKRGRSVVRRHKLIACVGPSPFSFLAFAVTLCTTRRDLCRLRPFSLEKRDGSPTGSLPTEWPGSRRSASMPG